MSANVIFVVAKQYKHGNLITLYNKGSLTLVSAVVIIYYQLINAMLLIQEFLTILYTSVNTVMPIN